MTDPVPAGNWRKRWALQEWANVAEIVGAVAIVVSLIHVSLELSDNTRAIRSAAVNDASTSMQAWYLQVSGNEQLSSLFYRGIRDPESLSREELFQFFMSAHAAILGFQNAFELALEGTLDEDVKRSITMSLLATRNEPGFKLYWSQRAEYFTPEFRAFVDSLEGLDPRGMGEIYEEADQ